MSGSDKPAAGEASIPATDGGVSSASRPSRTDCVNPDTGPETASPEVGSDERQVLPIDRVEEFRREYPYLADLPLTEQDGRSLRREVTEADYEPEYVEPVRETDRGFVTYRLVERRAATWADAMFAFLDAHQRYEDGMYVRFEGIDKDGEEAEFEVRLRDSWGDAYANKEYARAMSLERQLVGGEHPDGTQVEGEWSNIMTAMLTFTGSSTPDGEHLPPVDQFDPVSDTWSYEGVRDTVRNICENDLGLESHEWGYLRFAEPHGVGAAESEGQPGANACYSHTHVGVYLDLDVDEDYLERLFYKAIRKHLEVCNLAGEDAHTRENSVSVNADVANMGSYLSAYMRTYSEDTLIERPIEYIAWASVMWSMNRQRVGRSRVLNEAIRADACEAGYRAGDQLHDHGDRLEHRSSGYGSRVVCASCGSGWGIDQDAETISECRLAGPNSTNSVDLEACEHESYDYTESVSYGESTTRAAARSEIKNHIETHGPPKSIPTLLGRLNLSPDHFDLVEEVIAGENSAEEIQHWKEEPQLSLEEWEVVAFIDSDGEEYRPSSSGGVEMVETYLPVKRILERTRLRYVGDGEHPHIRCKKCRVASYSPGLIAACLAREHNIDNPAIADQMIEFTRFNGDLPPEFDPPDPPDKDSVLQKEL